MVVADARRAENPAVALDPPELDNVLYRVQVLGVGGEAGQRSSSDDDEEDEAVFPRSGSITTCTSVNRRSLSPSARSASTTATSRSSHEHIKGKRKPAPLSRPTLVGKAHSTTDYHVFLARVEQPPQSPSRLLASPPLTHPLPSPTSPLSPSLKPSSLPAPSLAPSSLHAPRKPYDSIRRRLTKLSRTTKDKSGGEVTYVDLSFVTEYVNDE